MSARRPLVDELLLAIAPTVAGQVLTAVRGIVRREHEEWMRRRALPPKRGRK